MSTKIVKDFIVNDVPLTLLAVFHYLKLKASQFGNLFVVHKGLTLTILSILAALLVFAGHGIYVVFAVFLFFQNYSYTYVSRARNSGSLVRHVKAAVFSNGIYAFNLLMTISVASFLGHGILLTGALIAFYTVFTVAGSVFAHHQSLQSEKGLNAVGANKKYAQILVEDWEKLHKAFKTSVLTTATLSEDVIGFVLQSYDEHLEKVAKMKELGDALAANHNQVPAGDPLATPVIAPVGTAAPILGVSASEVA
jgi:hypothetical protein